MSMVSSVSSATQMQELSPYTQGGRLDPYAIFQLNFQAMGGEKAVKQESTYRFKGEMTLGSDTFEYQEIIKKPLKALKIISSNFRVIYKNGDDGQFMWSWQNGKVSSYDDEGSPEREIKKLWDEYAYTDPKNREFRVKAGGKKTIDGVSCYEVTITNRKTDEVVTHYYDAQTFLLKREVREGEYDNVQTDFSEYKNVGNIKVAFQRDLLFLDDGTKQSITWKNVERGVFLPDSLFDVPEDKSRPSDLSAFTGTGAKVDTYA